MKFIITILLLLCFLIVPLTVFLIKTNDMKYVWGKENLIYKVLYHHRDEKKLWQEYRDFKNNK